MSIQSAQDVLNLQNATAQQKLAEKEANGPSQELDQDAFLMLMMEQLKNQDPLNPMDNSQMLAQQAQFTQISELQKMNETLTSSNMIMQATSLVGKEVTLVDPDDTTKTISGVVTSANFNSSYATITVNGEEYPLGLVIGISDGSSAVAPPDGDSGNDSGTESGNGSTGGGSETEGGTGSGSAA